MRSPERNRFVALALSDPLRVERTDTILLDCHGRRLGSAMQIQVVDVFVARKRALD